MENNNQAGKNSSKRNQLMFLAAFIFLIAGAIGLFYVYLAKNQVYTEKSSIEAPIIGLSSGSGGTLEKLFVKTGDSVEANSPVAQVGNDIVKTKDAGVIISANNDIGKNFAPGEPVANMIKPSDLRVVAQVEEDKGLSDIRVGQKAYFTVDAFGSKRYSGLVDEVSPTSRSSDIVFNISNTREAKEFDVKIRFSLSDYPELKNGMSAKTWIYKN
jgi:multidrug resistance efflux pump